MRRVVITGLGVVSPLGVGAQPHWDSLISCRSAVVRSQRLLEQSFPVAVAAEVSDHALKEHFCRLPRKQLKLFSRVTLFGMIASSLAAEDAGLASAGVDPRRCGISLGTFFTTLEFPLLFRWITEAERADAPAEFDLARANAFCMNSINPMDFSLKTMPNLTAGHIAIAHNAQGFCRVVADGCTGGLQAIGQAWWAIREGDIDVALCGGAEAPLQEFIMVNFCTLNFLAEGIEDPERACRPFDVERSGTVLGEGAALLVLEEREHALRRGARIHGEFLGFGSAVGDPEIDPRFDGFQEKSSGIERLSRRMGVAMRAALAEAGIDRVDVIAPNGDGTKSHDLAEARAIRDIFGPEAATIPISATKPMHGHLISASGALEAANCLLALDRNVIPPTVNIGNPDPRCGLNSVCGEPRRAAGIETALVNATGLFGDSASVIIGKGA